MYLITGYQYPLEQGVRCVESAVAAAGQLARRSNGALSRANSNARQDEERPSHWGQGGGRVDHQLLMVTYGRMVPPRLGLSRGAAAAGTCAYVRTGFST